MSSPSLEARVENIDRRLGRVEQILPTLATKEDLKAFATKEDLKAFATKEDLKAFATKEDLKAFATKEDLKGFATKDDLKAFATSEELKAYPTRVELTAALDEQRRAILQDMRVLFEEQQAFIRVLAEGIQACNERVDRVDAESRARDVRLETRVDRLERHR